LNQKDAEMHVILVEFRPVMKGQLLGFATIEVPAWGITVHDVTVCKSGDRVWASPWSSFSDAVVAAVLARFPEVAG
jgi:hypothetical protein